MRRELLEDFQQKYRILIDEDRKLLKRDLIEFRKSNLEELDSLKKLAIENFKKNGIEVISVKSYSEARDELRKFINKGEKVVKSKSNCVNRIQLENYIKDADICETDLGDFVSKIMGTHDEHPVLPSLSLKSADIAKKLEEFSGEKIKPEPNKIALFVRKFLRKKINEADIGLTGANLITADGEIILLENEGNISLVSRIPDTHIAVTSVGKLVKNSIEAVKVTQALAHWGTGQNRASYINIISGPSKSADIENKVITGAQGAKKVILIIIDDRGSYPDEIFNEINKCIN
ncbi:MAG TPA: lactate utilization protein, partial [bacterium]|nr:lactate utilization protein [bacterium]